MKGTGTSTTVLRSARVNADNPRYGALIAAVGWSVSKKTKKEKPHTRTGRTVIGSAILIREKPIKHSETRQLQTAKEKQQHAEQHSRWRSTQTAAGMGLHLHTDIQHQKHEGNRDHGGTCQWNFGASSANDARPPLCASSGAIFCLLQQPPRKILIP